MKISVTVEGMAGLTWPRWKRLVDIVEQLGFAGLFRSDHFTLTTPPDLASLEIEGLEILAENVTPYVHA